MKIDINLSLQDAYGGIRKVGNEIFESLKEKLKGYYEKCTIEETLDDSIMAFPFSFHFNHKLDYIRAEFGINFDWETNTTKSFQISIIWDKVDHESYNEFPIEKIYDERIFDAIKKALKLEISEEEYDELMELIK